VAKTIDQLLDEARARLRRLSPAETADALRAGALVVDTRPAAQREHEGGMPGALVIERNVLERRLEPRRRRAPGHGVPQRHRRRRWASSVEGGRAARRVKPGRKS
jgi:hypothetical protein